MALMDSFEFRIIVRIEIFISSCCAFQTVEMVIHAEDLFVQYFHNFYPFG